MRRIDHVLLVDASRAANSGSTGPLLLDPVRHRSPMSCQRGPAWILLGHLAIDGSPKSCRRPFRAAEHRCGEADEGKGAGDVPQGDVGRMSCSACATRRPAPSPRPAMATRLSAGNTAAVEPATATGQWQPRAKYRAARPAPGSDAAGRRRTIARSIRSILRSRSDALPLICRDSRGQAHRRPDTSSRASSLDDTSRIHTTYERPRSGIRNDRVVVLRGDAAEADRLAHQHRDAFGLHLLHDLRAIAFDRARADLELRGDCLAGEALRPRDRRSPTCAASAARTAPSDASRGARCWLCCARVRASPRLIAATSCASSTGFSMKSSAPALIAATAIGTSACPEMSTTGSAPRRASSRTSSMPSMPGMRTSATTQPRGGSSAARSCRPIRKVST